MWVFYSNESLKSPNVLVILRFLIIKNDTVALVKRQTMSSMQQDRTIYLFHARFPNPRHVKKCQNIFKRT